MESVLLYLFGPSALNGAALPNRPTRAEMRTPPAVVEQVEPKESTPAVVQPKKRVRPERSGPVDTSDWPSWIDRPTGY